MNCLRIPLRFLLLRSHSSKVPTAITPLIDIKSVVIFVDHKDEHCEPAIALMTRFFESQGIKAKVISAEDADIRTSSDMFLAVNGKPSVSELYAARSSTARFKVGRHQLRRNVYDLVISESGEQPLKVDAYFEEIKPYFAKVK